MGSAERSGDSRATAARMVGDALLAGPARLGDVRLLTIDGRSGAGKTSLAAAVTTALTGRVGPNGPVGVQTVHVEDMYAGWRGLDDDLVARIEDQVLRPLGQGRPARWQRYDWAAGRFGEWVEAPPADVVVLEGCGSAAAPSSSLATLGVWLHASADRRRRRALARDGAVFAPHWDAWAALEELHYARHPSPQPADLVLDLA